MAPQFLLRNSICFSDITSKVLKKQQAVHKLDNNSTSIKQTVEISSSNLNDIHPCSDLDGGELHREEELLKQNENHTAFTCPDTSECLADDKRPFGSWPKVLRQITSEHSEAVEVQTQPTTLSSTAKRTKSQKCTYNHCPLLFNSSNKFHHHLIKCHPYALRCPYSSDCNQADSAENYAGLMELEQHIKTNHSAQYQNFKCFDRVCQQERKFPNWQSVIDHIVIKHWTDITSN